MVANRSVTSTFGSNGDEWQMLVRNLRGKTITVNLDGHQSMQDSHRERT